MANVAMCLYLSYGGSTPPNAQNLKHGAAGVFYGGPPLDGGCGPSLAFQCKSN
jgi:hypothetical protein